jgi:lipopolysaccharide transport system permease protein
MVIHARHLINASDLIWTWTVRTIRGRYQQSALGWLWAVIQPAATVTVFTIIFTRFVPVNTGDVPYIVFSYMAVVPWALLASSLGDMTVSLVQNMNLISKIYFPREALPIAALLARAIDFGISSILLAVLMVYFRLPLSYSGLLCLPVILGIQVALILGIGIGCAALNVFYRDVDPLLRLGLQIWFYASPIIYPVSMVPEEWRSFYFLNPMAGVIEGYRDVLLNGRLPGLYLLPSAIMALIILVLGYWFFKRVEFQFADIV